jgi:hypothetical protein
MKDISSLVFPIYLNKEDVFYLRIFTFIYRTCDFREFILSNNNQILTDVPQIWKQKPKNRKQKQKTKKKKLSEVGFEPTPSFEDQNLSLAP